MAEPKPNRVRVVPRNDGQFRVRIVASNGKTVAESEKVYGTRGAALTAAKALVNKPLELDTDS